ncbi:MAG: hypothetical protein N838_10300 [Thiohalocapsa sp. PB-PSB1]|jgi:hypothetical protein|nr:MAG: hypothetical protein N838_10300 [Thiohalocapsa sp. PB-PSB1]
MMIEKDTNRNEEIIIRHRKNGIFIGITLWIVIIITSIVGTIFVNWTMIPASIFVGLVLGSYIGSRINRKIMKETGLDLKTQQAIWKRIFYRT